MFKAYIFFRQIRGLFSVKAALEDKKRATANGCAHFLLKYFILLLP